MITPVSGTPNLLLGAYDLATLGYGAEEFFISGTAGSHSGETADYVTRIVVCRPADDADFTGTVIVEWLNVSGGIDAPAVWFMAHRGIVRAGFAYVAVSAQQVGVEGRSSSSPLLAFQAIDQRGQVSRLYLAGLATSVQERLHALRGGLPSERFTMSSVGSRWIKVMSAWATEKSGSAESTITTRMSSSAATSVPNLLSSRMRWTSSRFIGGLSIVARQIPSAAVIRMRW